jgi:hypothetical protein
MNAEKNRAVELPAHPTDKEFEEYVAAHLQCAGSYVERSIVERDVKEVLELDIITTDYDASPPDVRLIEIKSGGWGFPEIFKVYGWLKYLEIEKGALVVKVPKEAADVQRFYADKAKTLQIELAVVDSVAQASTALSTLLNGKTVEQIDQSLWRFSYWMERNVIKRLIAKKKSAQNAKRFLAMDDYLFAVNSGVFFTQGAVNRAQQLYTAFKQYPRISAKCAHEELGQEFDDDVSTIDNALFKRTFYCCEYTDIQISLYIEHRARLVILKNAIDYLLYAKAGQDAKAGSKTTKLFGLNFTNAPESFLKGLEVIATHKHFRRYPVFWQWFMWLFGGFILKDYENEDYQALSARTGIPTDEIPVALTSYEILFPQSGGWFRDEPYSNVRVMKMFPVPFMGIGANLRKNLYTKDGDYGNLKLSGQYTMSDLVKWNNLAVEVLSQR